MSASIYMVERDGDGSKKSWPEVVGLSVEEAKKVILKDMPDANIVVLPVGFKEEKDTDSKPNCVRIFVDTVAETPRIG
ncbi:hypothetical protein HU200_053782 [Digitaria exilis]|uniref:Uncharacterized protein n=1 Tax=Digitaria exilis TaxID=1010633 RepID=A0A835AGR2_9POAL|nr:hypothetical protein HU200_053782 [Digitaria exilis]